MSGGGHQTGDSAISPGDSLRVEAVMKGRRGTNGRPTLVRSVPGGGHHTGDSQGTTVGNHKVTHLMSARDAPDPGGRSAASLHHRLDVEGVIGRNRRVTRLPPMRSAECGLRRAGPNFMESLTA